MCVCVCVCERERERQTDRQKERERVNVHVQHPEPAFEGGKWGDRPRPHSGPCPQTGKNFISNKKTKFAVMVGPRPRVLLTPLLPAPFLNMVSRSILLSVKHLTKTL